jgi:hypothetical protein
MATINLIWDAPDPSGSGGVVQTYNIYRADGDAIAHPSGETVVSLGSSQGSTLSSVRAFTQTVSTQGDYSYAITAVNEAGESDPSNSQSVVV